MRALRPIIIGFLVSALLVGTVATSAGADTHTDQARAWLTNHQQDDGGFELSGFPGFETPDAILAIAAAAQTGPTWNTTAARAAVEAVVTDPGGLSALDWVDSWLDGDLGDPPAAGQQAKLILEVAGPLGFDPTAFDPAGDGGPVDLTTDLDTIAPGLFNSYLFGRLAESVLDENVHQNDLQVICEAQKATGGGWSYDADPAGPNAADMDTTGFSIMALVAAGVRLNDPALAQAQQFVLDGQVTAPPDDAGSWLSFGSPDPNATALGMFAVTALGIALDDLDQDPVAWLQSQQLPVEGDPDDDGRIVSPNDAFVTPPAVPNSFATTQAIQALLLDQVAADWLPVPPGGSPRRCLPASTFGDVAPAAPLDNAARWADATNVVAGRGGNLDPQANVNRAQAAVWLNKMFGSPGGARHHYVDVPRRAWYRAGVNFVGDAPNGRIATGYGDEFRPRRNLNRGQAVTWLYAAAGSPSVAGLPPHGFSDVPPNTRLSRAVRWAKANGIASGFDDGRFRRNGNVRRGRMVQWMYNLAATPDAWRPGAVLPPTLIFSPSP